MASMQSFAAEFSCRRMLEVHSGTYPVTRIDYRGHHTSEDIVDAGPQEARKDARTV